MTPSLASNFETSPVIPVRSFALKLPLERRSAYLCQFSVLRHKGNYPHLSAKALANTRVGGMEGLDNEPPRVYRLGLTGSIGMGKTTVGKMFEQKGVPVLDADAVVHRLYGEGGAAVGPVGQTFPSALVGNAISRPELAKYVVGNQAALKALEELVHPLVSEERQRWLRSLDPAANPIAVLDIPLLYETGAEKTVDAVVVVTASAEVQKERVLQRPGMTPEKFASILARQLPDHEKRRRADYLIHTKCSLSYTEEAVDELIAYLKQHAL